jgi:hypothetical protein
MERHFNNFWINWNSQDGRVTIGTVKTVIDMRPPLANTTLFDFLSGLGITKNQCIKAFDDEDK